LLFFAFWASWGVWRFRVGRSGSSEGALPLAVVDVDPESVVVVSLGVRRVMVGRSGSSAGVLPVVVDDPVVLVVLVGAVEGSELSWCFMVGRSGSSAGVLPGAVVVPLLAVLSVSEDRRFMVGRSGSSVVAVLAEVVPGLGAGLLESLLAVGAASPFDLVVR